MALTQDFQKQRLKSALWYRIGKIVDEETLKLGVNATPQFIGSLTELTWAQIGRHSILLGSRLRWLYGRNISFSDTCVCRHSSRSVFLRPGMALAELTRLFSVANAAQDLESFASHAGRRTIKTDDVMLLTRRNEGLETILKDFVEKLKVRNENAKKAEGAAGKKRKANGVGGRIE
jgi:centromere protein S